MDKVDAIFALAAEAQAQRTTKTGITRAARACKALGLSEAETRRVFHGLDVADHDGKPYTHIKYLPEVHAAICKATGHGEGK